MIASLGPSNDDSAAVQIEISAALLDGQRGIPLGHDASQGHRAHQYREDPPFLASAAWWTGWLLREIASHDALSDRDADAWAWDISRPLAEQFAETVRDDAAADAMVHVTPENLTDEQIREFHDSLDLDVEGDGVLALHCSTALMPENAMSAQAFPAAKAAARRRVCEAINARSETSRGRTDGAP